ncbi:MAG: hypothetical protein ACK5L5_04990 [Bacteroidales bacterium]
MNNVFLFDPTCEMAIANSSPYYQPPQNIVHFTEQLSWLPSLLADSSDYLISKHPYSDRFVDALMDLRRNLPRIVEEGQQYNFQRFIPWGWSPMIHHKYKSIKQMCDDAFFRMPNSQWNPEVQKYYERTFALTVCKELINIDMHKDGLIAQDELPIVVRSITEFDEMLKRMHKAMIKLPLSSSGRGVLKVDTSSITENERGRVKKMIEAQSYIMLEKYLNIKAEFGMLFSYFEGEGLKFHGFSFTKTNNGRYCGNLVNRTPPSLSNSLLEGVRQELVPALTTQFKKHNLFDAYNGYFGVDACIYNENGSLKINPCMEINLRMTMGHIALALTELLAKTSQGEFGIYGGKNFEYFCAQMRNVKPLIISDRKIVSGFVSLSPESNKARSGAYLIVDRNRN